MTAAYKIPESVLVVIHTADLQVLLLERADRPGFWQSVTGSKETPNEALTDTVAREVMEETGIDVQAHELTDWRKQNRYEIFRRWRGRYAPGVTHNAENVFGLRLSEVVPVKIAPREHLGYVWLPWREAADKVFSWSNAEAIRELPARSGTTPNSISVKTL